MGHPGALVLAGGVVALGLGFLVGSRSIAGEAAYAGVGPRAVPVVVGAGLALAGLAFGISVGRGATFTTAEPPATWRALLLLLAGLVGAVVVIEPLGFAVAAALVFTASARAFGSRRPVVDAAVGLGLGVLVYVIFSRGLGVSLPGGPLEWLS